MSRTALCACTAAALAMAALATMAARSRMLGSELGASATDSARTSNAEPSTVKKIFLAASIQGLPNDEKHLVELLLLFPVAALIIVVFRNLIGLTTFGTFTPALLGLAFRDWSAWQGMLAFIVVVVLGWFLRRGLDRFHLLQVPRVSVMLCLVVTLLTAFVIASHRLGLETSRHVSLFPLVILAGMIERLWTLEEEDGIRASSQTLLTTLFVAACVGLVIGRPAIGRFVTNFPESVGLTAAAMMLLGRYTGYRLTELYRFRELLSDPETDTAALETWSKQEPFDLNRF